MSFAKSVVLLLSAFTCVQAVATPHAIRNAHHHRAVAHRAAPTTENLTPIALPAKKRDLRKRSLTKRCQARPSLSATSSSSSSSAAASSSAPAENVGSDPSTFFSSSSTSQFIPSTTETPTSQFTPSTTETPTETPTEAPTSTFTPTSTTPTSTFTPTTSSQAAATTAASSSSSSDGASSFLAGTNSGQGTFYETGLGACGITNTDTDFICAVSEALFDIYPGYNGVNPNSNPVCGRQITASYQGKSVTVTVTDRCTGCDETSLDFSPSAFSTLADQSLGRIDITWEWAS